MAGEPRLPQISTSEQNRLAAPAHAPLQHPEVEIGEPPRHPAEKQRLRERFAGVGEMPDLVVHVVGHRTARAVALHERVRGGRDAQLDALRPERVVVELRVEREVVDPVGEVAQRRIVSLHRLQRAVHEARDHRDLQIERVDRVLQLLDGLGRGEHRDRCGRRHPVRVFAVELGHHRILGAAAGASNVLLGLVEEEEPEGRVDDGEVEPQLVEPLAQQPGQHGCGPVEGIPRRNPPERRPGGAMDPAFLGGERVPAPVLALARALEVVLDHLRACRLLQEVQEHRDVLQHMAVAVHDRVVQSCANFSGGCVGMGGGGGGHGRFSPVT